MEYKKINVEVVSRSSENLKDFVKLLKLIRFCTVKGMSRTIKIQIDGDGSADYYFKVNGEEIPVLNHSIEEIDEYLENNKIWLGE